MPSTLYLTINKRARIQKVFAQAASMWTGELGCVHMSLTGLQVQHKQKHLPLKKEESLPCRVCTWWKAWYFGSLTSPSIMPSDTISPLPFKNFLALKDIVQGLWEKQLLCRQSSSHNAPDARHFAVPMHLLSPHQMLLQRVDFGVDKVEWR